MKKCTFRRVYPKDYANLYLYLYTRGNVLAEGNYKTANGPVYTYYTYDSKGLYVTHVKKNNITNKMEYDSMGHITKATYGNGNSVTYTYDLYGNQIGSNDGKYTTRTVYNYGNNDVTYYDENNKGKLYDYNGIGQLMSVKDVTTNKILATYTYDIGNLLMKTATIGGKSKLEIEYNALNEITARRILDLQNNSGVTYGETYSRSDYDGYQQITTTITGGTNSPEINNISKIDYEGYEIYSKVNGVETANTYDLAGNLLTSVTDSCTTTMQYNGLNLMTKVTKPKGGVYTYGYDMLGRNTSVKSPNGAVTNYSYDDSDRVTLESTPMTSNSQKSEKKYTYDNNGNVKTESIKTNLACSATATYRTTEYIYDTKNNLIKVQNVDKNNNEWLY